MLEILASSSIFKYIDKQFSHALHPPAELLKCNFQTITTKHADVQKNFKSGVMLKYSLIDTVRIPPLGFSPSLQDVA